MSAELHILPTVGARRRHKQGFKSAHETVSIRLTREDAESLRQIARGLGIAIDDAAGRVLRNALRLRAPHAQGAGE